MVNADNSAGSPAPIPLAPIPRKQIVLQIALGALIFICGAILGVGGTIYYLKGQGIRLSPHSHRTAEEIAAEVTEKYGLNASQQQQVTVIFEKLKERIEARREQRAQEIEKDSEVVAGEMKAVMTEEQYSRWYPEFKKKIETIKNRK